MENIISTVVILDPEGKLWSTPKGKRQWSSIAAAKNAWNCHNWKKRVNKYNPKLLTPEQCKWSVDAEPAGWVIKEEKFKVTPL